MAAETGSGGAFSMFQIKWSIDLMRQSANWGYLPVGDVLRSDIPGRFAMAVRKPLGVVAGFTPWNGAFSLAWRTIALPMAFGNTVVLKTSELAPISAGLLLAEILEEAGFPPGVLNVVTHAPAMPVPSRMCSSKAPPSAVSTSRDLPTQRACWPQKQAPL